MLKTIFKALININAITLTIITIVFKLVGIPLKTSLYFATTYPFWLFNF